MANLVLILFMIFAAVAAVMTVFSRNTVTCALSLLGVMFCLACIYAMIGAHFVAGLQLIVYAGAVMVLFIFIIMLLNPALLDMKPDLQGIKPNLIVSLVFGGFVLLFLTRGFMRFVPTHPMMEGSFTPEKISDLGGNVKVLSQALLSEYYLPFEILSIVLLASIVGSILIARRKTDV